MVRSTQGQEIKRVAEHPSERAKKWRQLNDATEVQHHVDLDRVFGDLGELKMGKAELNSRLE
jgi:hypothetical protein